MKTSNLKKLLKVLKKQSGSTALNYSVPDLWNCFDYKSPELMKLPSNELLVNPYNFYSYVIENYILPNMLDDVDYHQSLSSIYNKPTPKRNYIGGDWIKESVVYSTMIRTSAAWDNDRTNTVDTKNIYQMNEMGSFVKMLALLPLLKKMGVNTVYMLPISKFSLKDKKGELGSPYGVSNFNTLDPNLKDSLTKDNMTLDEEFSAFVEACHILDMRIMIDIIPRTNAVENDLIKEYPEWFYWIKNSEYDNYKVPYIDGIASTIQPTISLMEKVYKSKDTLRHLDMFQFNPKHQNEKLWNSIKDKENLSLEIAENFDLRVAPAFSDHINDTQPPWTDITFFRMFNDIPSSTIKFVDNVNRPPYILFDTIKSNKFLGEKPNLVLWNKLANIVPSYQTRFGIDGARIDMGHALPKQLVTMIFDKARTIDKDFCFIAEELNTENTDKAKTLGYNMIIGNGFIMEPRVFEGKLKEFVYGVNKLSLPVFACGETHDTPRLASRDGGETLAKFLTVLNMFISNAVPFINSGQEVFEKQPMNTGIDCKENGEFRLDKNDPLNGKLALFDKYQFHYTNHRRWDIPDTLDLLKPIRKLYIKEIINKDRFFPLLDSSYPSTFLGYAFYKKSKKTKNTILLILGNSNPYHEIYTKVDITKLRKETLNSNTDGKLLFSTHEQSRPFTQFENSNTLDIHLGACEIKIVEL
ncbi:MAG: hypothetical protein QM489_02525 [Candidatus Izemoplasma sp.]